MENKKLTTGGMFFDIALPKNWIFQRVIQKNEIVNEMSLKAVSAAEIFLEKSLL